LLHWFRSKDLRAEDNRALHAASIKASDARGYLLTCFLYSPRDIEWHGTSPARTDFMLRGLELLREQLEGLNIPLVFLTAEDRGMKTDKVLEFVRENDVSHVYANMEYEVDELRRDVDMFGLLDKEGEGGVQFMLHHDQTVVEPLKLTTGSGGPMKVFTPYHKAWLAEVANEPELIDTLPAPRGNDKSVRTGDKTKALFDSSLPKAPESKQYASHEERDRLRKLWPPGHEAAMKRLSHFLDDKVDTYSTHRSDPSRDNASRMSAYFASGMISVREALSATREQKGDKESSNNKKKDNADFSQSGPGGSGVAAWVREIVFREFYRHMMVVTPHTGMNLPNNLKFDFVEWEDDEEGWSKWCEGRTGVPFVDAGIRQINHEVSVTSILFSFFPFWFSSFSFFLFLLGQHLSSRTLKSKNDQLNMREELGIHAQPPPHERLLLPLA
jgi:deoxyribodipyrimidine photo-lyase